LDIVLHTIYKGAVKHVVALAIDGKSAARDYLQETEKTKPKEFTKLSVRIQSVADTYQFRNSEIFRSEGNGIYAFKTSGGLRLYAFNDENQLLVACFGADKAKKKQQQKDCQQARKWMDRYLEYKGSGANIEIRS